MFKRKEGVIVIIAVVIILISVVGYILLNPPKTGEEYKYYSYISKRKISDYDLEPNNFVTIKWHDVGSSQEVKINSDDYIGRTEFSTHKYLLIEERKLEGFLSYRDADTPAFNRDYLKQGEFWNVVLYQIDSKNIKKLKTIPLVETVKKYKDGFRPYEITATEVDGEIYVYIGIQDGASYEVVYLNTVSGQLLSDLPQKKREYQNGFVYFSSLYDRLMEKGIRFISENNYITLDKKARDSIDSWEITNEYPEAAKILKEGGTLYLLGDGEYTSMDSAVKTLKLLAPRGEDIFDGVTIEANYSTDGKEHTVKTYEEFKHYYKQPEIEED